MNKCNFQFQFLILITVPVIINSHYLSYDTKNQLVLIMISLNTS